MLGYWGDGDAGDEDVLLEGAVGWMVGWEEVVSVAVRDGLVRWSRTFFELLQETFLMDERNAPHGFASLARSHPV